MTGLGSPRRQLQELLGRYKNADPAQASEEMTILAAVLARFVNRHLRCIEGRVGALIDVVTTVPSTSGRSPHPLVVTVRRSRLPLPRHQELLTRGDAPAGHNLAGAGVFETRHTLRRERVLLVDDTLTSGARIQSAASRLRLAGARSVVAVIVGRVIDPGCNASCQELWSWSTRRQFSFDRCCWCVESARG